MIDPTPDTPNCPICGGHMEVVYSRHQHIVVVCVDCHSGVTIPVRSLDVVRQKRSGVFKPGEPDS